MKLQGLRLPFTHTDLFSLAINEVACQSLEDLSSFEKKRPPIMADSSNIIYKQVIAI